VTTYDPSRPNVDRPSQPKITASANSDVNLPQSRSTASHEQHGAACVWIGVPSMESAK
jgi:hypothetical protein